MPPSPLIDLTAVRFAWRADLPPVIDIPRFQLAPGERVFLHGESGSGKSTLLSLIAGVITAQSGAVRVLGEDFSRCKGALRDHLRAAHLGFIFQQFNLIPYLSGLDNITLACQFAPARAAKLAASGRTPRQVAAELATRLDLTPALLQRPACTLSVGQQQRVAAARALIGGPSLVIADEPTSALDATRQAGFINLLLSECAAVNAALLMVSHDMQLARHFDRVVALSEINRAPTGAGT